MSTLTQYTKERDRATTEWDDIQRRIGNLPALEAPPAEDSPFPELEQPVAAAAALESASVLSACCRNQRRPSQAVTGGKMAACAVESAASQRSDVCAGFDAALSLSCAWR